MPIDTTSNQNFKLQLFLNTQNNSLYELLHYYQIQCIKSQNKSKYSKELAEYFYDYYKATQVVIDSCKNIESSLNKEKFIKYLLKDAEVYLLKATAFKIFIDYTLNLVEFSEKLIFFNLFTNCNNIFIINNMTIVSHFFSNVNEIKFFHNYIQAVLEKTQSNELLAQETDKHLSLIKAIIQCTNKKKLYAINDFFKKINKVDIYFIYNYCSLIIYNEYIHKIIKQSFTEKICKENVLYIKNILSTVKDYFPEQYTSQYQYIIQYNDFMQNIYNILRINETPEENIRYSKLHYKVTIHANGMSDSINVENITRYRSTLSVNFYDILKQIEKTNCTASNLINEQIKKAKEKIYKIMMSNYEKSKLRQTNQQTKTKTFQQTNTKKFLLYNNDSNHIQNTNPSKHNINKKCFH